jgi:nucleoside-diphosphate-sugar epimerase
VKILITGVNGFVGMPLSHYLTSAGHQVVGVVRSHDSVSKVNIQTHLKVISDINQSTDWQECLSGVECVIHLANRAHVMDEQSINPLALYRKVNTAGTLNLARQAASVGVKRFIFISSIKVNGESTFPGQALTLEERPIPVDPYGLSKYEAELGLKLIAEKTSLEVVVIRPPLIYGPGVKANFLKMMQWVEKGIPLPLGAINNQRSMLGIDNLINFIELCLIHPDAAGQTFLVSDDYDVSTTELLREIAAAMHRPSRLISIPQFFIDKLLIFLGQRHISERLCGSLQLDISLAKTRLSWKPPYSFKDQLTKTALDYLSIHQGNRVSF